MLHFTFHGQQSYQRKWLSPQKTENSEERHAVKSLT